MGGEEGKFRDSDVMGTSGPGDFGSKRERDRNAH